MINVKNKNKMFEMFEIFKKYNPYISLLLLTYNIWKNDFSISFSFKYLNFEISVKFL